MTVCLKLWGALIVFLLAAGSVWAATPAQYDGALAQVQAALSSQARAVGAGKTLPTAQTPERVAARVLAPILSVQPPGGPPRPVNTALLRQSITAAGTLTDHKQRVKRLQELSSQIAVLRRELTTSQADRKDALTERQAVDAAHTVLAGAAYDSEPYPEPTKWDRWKEARARAFQRWLDSLHFGPRTPTGPMPTISPQFINGIVIALGIGLFALLVALLVGLLRRRAARARPAADLDETEAALVEARDMDSLHALAERKAQEGDYRLALRFIYLALLVALDTGGVLRFDRSRTNWEYLRALRASGREDVYQAMTPLTREFDRVWYGLARADAADYARARSQYEALQAVSQTPTTPKKAAATT